jgi:molybdenum cofactor biosynthesis enzyme MoaA
MIKSLNLEIIDICNLQCIMCDIWKNKNPNLLSCEDINNILSSKNIKKNIDITIT